jgi:hypothetical protein
MNLYISHFRITVCFSFLLVGLIQSLLATAPLTKLWTYDSGVLPDGRMIFNAGLTPTVGTDGSLAFSVYVQDDLGLPEYSLFWFEKEQADPNNPIPLLATIWSADKPQPVAVRLNHLMYMQKGLLSGDTVKKDHLYSFEKGDADPTLIDSFATDDTTAWMIEQSRGPGVLYIFEAQVGDTSFKLHAYQIDPASTDELLVPTIIGVEGGNTISLRFPAVADAMYQIETTTDLSAVEWTADREQIAGNDTNILMQRPAPASGNVFYRIRKL